MLSRWRKGWWRTCMVASLGVGGCARPTPILPIGRYAGQLCGHDGSRTPRITEERHWPYFPAGVLGNAQGYDVSFSSAFEFVGEDPLWPLMCSRAGGAYRVSWSDPRSRLLLVVRMQRDSAGVRIVAHQRDDMAPHECQQDIERAATQADWDRLVQAIDAAGFWNATSREGWMDNVDLLVEGVDAQRFQAVDMPAPPEAWRCIAQVLVEVAQVGPLSAGECGQRFASSWSNGCHP